jgi:hypothetical protein
MTGESSGAFVRETMRPEGSLWNFYLPGSPNKCARSRSKAPESHPAFHHYKMREGDGLP